VRLFGRFVWCSLVLFALALPAHADPQPAIVLVAKPGLRDPNFRETVVLVLRTPGAQTLGVILNRPTDLKLAQLWQGQASADSYKDPVFFGGPVLNRTLVALFRSATPPPAPAFEVLEHVYLSMHPDNLERLLAQNAQAYRLYAGFSGWAPTQLEAEIEREGWYVVPAREDLLFRKNTAGLWLELVEQATGARAQLY
jgi:putative transcriptional regulator